MPRRLRCNTGGYVYHVLNRAVGRSTLFHKDGDYAAFEKVLRQAKDWQPIRLLGYCLMPNHWHLLLWPAHDGDLSEFMRWLTVTHTQRYHAHYHTSGEGPLYQGRFKSFPIQEDEHFLTVLRYVERNPLRAGLVQQAEDWRWSSLWQRRQRGPQPLIEEGPVPLPRSWRAHVNAVQTEAELEALRRRCAGAVLTEMRRGCPRPPRSWDWRQPCNRRVGRPRRKRARQIDKRLPTPFLPQLFSITIRGLHHA